MDRSGAPLAAWNVIRRLPRDRYRVSLATGPADEGVPDLTAEVADAGVPVFPVPRLRRDPHPARDAAAFLELARIIGRDRYDLVHCHKSKAGFLGRLAARCCGIPRVVYTPHGNVLEGYFGPAATWLYARMEGLASAFSDRIVSLTRLEREGYLAEGIGRPEQHRVIPSGIDLAPFAGERADRDEIRRELGAGPGSFLVASVGRLVPIKGHPHLVEAFAEVSRRRPGSRLMLVGDGPLRAALDGRIRELGLEGGVLLTGHRDDVARLLRAADLFVLPSLNEGLGMVLVEAMASGLATVASRVGGIPEVVLDRDTGLLVPPGDPGALADAILRLADDEGERRRMGRAGRDRAFEVFSIERTVRETEGLYEELADRP